MPWLTRQERDRIEQEAMRQFLAERREAVAVAAETLPLTKWDRLFLWILRIDAEVKELV
jgi:hypothetical protein